MKIEILGMASSLELDPKGISIRPIWQNIFFFPVQMIFLEENPMELHCVHINSTLQ
jgi:hypothetical protein